jgi:hypothetical protein
VKAITVSGAGVSSDESDVFIVRILQNIEEPTVTVNGTVSEDWYPDGTTITAVNNQIFGADIISLQYKYNTESDELWKGYPAEGGIPVLNGSNTYWVRAAAFTETASPVNSSPVQVTAKIETVKPLLEVSMSSGTQPYAAETMSGQVTMSPLA